MKIPILSNLVEKRADEMLQEKRSLAKYDDYLDYLISGGDTNAAGVTVNEKTAISNTAVYACVRILAETVGSLPLVTYKRLEPRGKERATNHPLYKILHDAPNPYMTAIVFIETLMGHAATWGNAYADIEWGPNGQVKHLWPLRPDRMIKVDYDDSGKLVYIYQLPDNQKTVLHSDRVLHILGLGFDGFMAYSPIAKARDAIGLSVAAEKYGGRFFRNGARPGGVLRHPGKLGEDASKRLKEDWNKMHQGVNNSHRIAILEEGMDYTQIGLPPGDAQFIEVRKFQLQEVARIFRVPPHMLADLERATFSNIEHQSIDFVVHTIRPWLVRWEQAIKQKLLNINDRDTYFTEFLVDGLLRGDTATRYAAHAVARQWGWASANDIREIENQNPLPGEQGDVYLIPMNMIAAGQMNEPKPLPMIEEKSRSVKEQRSIKSAQNRGRLTKAYERVFADAMQRVVKREAADIRRAANKTLTERDSTDFMLYLEDYYKKAPEWIRKVVMPVFMTFADIIQAEAAKEVNIEAAMTPELEKFVDDYTDKFSAYYAGSSERQLKALVRDAPAEGLNPGDVVLERLDEWEEKRAEKTAMTESVRVSGAVAKFVFVGAGVRLLKWVTTGSNNCPYCKEMNGRVVGIEQPFLGKDDNLESEDGRMKINRPTAFPPLHQGCRCVIIPG